MSISPLSGSGSSLLFTSILLKEDLTLLRLPGLFQGFEVVDSMSILKIIPDHSY